MRTDRLNIDGLDLDLTGLCILPGLVNAHDHLEFALFPRLGQGPYQNAAEWARDVYRPDENPVRSHLAIPKPLRLFWGGLRNLLAGVTTVSHHNPYDPAFDDNFPVRVVKQFGWAHSFAFSPDIAECFAATPAGAPFIVHLAEGVDVGSAAEIHRLDQAGALGPRTVLVHAVGFSQDGWALVRERGASIVWCPSSNLFTLGQTLPARELLGNGIPLALATDSPLTAQGDLIDEIVLAAAHAGVRLECMVPLVTTSSAQMLRLNGRERDFIVAEAFGSPPDLVVIDGGVRLISVALMERCAPAIARQWSRIQLAGRPPVLVPFDIPKLVAQAQAALGSDTLFLGGRRVVS